MKLFQFLCLFRGFWQLCSWMIKGCSLAFKLLCWIHIIFREKRAKCAMFTRFGVLLRVPKRFFLQCVDFPRKIWQFISRWIGQFIDAFVCGNNGSSVLERITILKYGGLAEVLCSKLLEKRRIREKNEKMRFSWLANIGKLEKDYEELSVGGDQIATIIILVGKPRKIVRILAPYFVIKFEGLISPNHELRIGYCRLSLGFNWL